MNVELDYRNNIMPALNAIERFVHPNVTDRNVIGGRVMRDAKGKEIVDNSGGNAVIFKYELADRSVCALRMFKHFPVGDDRVQRLAPISQALTRVSSPALASYRFFNPGLQLANADDEIDQMGIPFVTPILVMGWVEGDSLGRYVKALCDAKDADELGRLLVRWIELVREMRRIGLAHGDITASNIMVRHSDRALVLVDYDDLYLPGLNDAQRKVEGTPGYRHPKLKGSRLYGPRMDDFSLLVMTASLAVLAEQPELFRSTDHLVFRKNDLEKTTSELFEKAKLICDAEAKKYVHALIDACHAAPDAPVKFDELVFESEIAEFEAAIRGSDRQAMRAGAEVIQTLSVWPRYALHYDDMFGRVKEKNMDKLRYILASENPDWVRETVDRLQIDMAQLDPDLRTKLDVLLNRS